MTYAYRNSSGDIVGLSIEERTLEEAQTKNPDIASVDPSPSQADLDTFELGVALAAEKRRKFAAIDARTDELIRLGFTYSGKQFSLSIESQMKMVGAHAARNEPAMTYPIIWNTLGDEGTYSIVDANDLNGFYLTGVGTLRALLDSGTALKDQIRQATTLAEVEAVTDSR